MKSRMTGPLVILDGVTLLSHETGKPLLLNISWRVERGDRWVLFGRNGSGKTRLLEIMTGNQYPSSGKVERYVSMERETDVRVFRRHSGYVGTPARERMYRSESILDIVLSGLFGTAALYDAPAPGDRDRARELIANAGLGGREEDSFGLLSDGERQKIMVARALMARPDILVLDEPCAGLDMGAREDLLESLGTVMEGSETALVLVTHHVEEIIPMFDGLFIIHEGRCVYRGDIAGGLTEGMMSNLFNRPVELTLTKGRYHSRFP